MTRAEVTVLAVGTHLFRWMQVGAAGARVRAGPRGWCGPDGVWEAS